MIRYDGERTICDVSYGIPKFSDLVTPKFTSGEHLLLNSTYDTPLTAREHDTEPSGKVSSAG